MRLWGVRASVPGVTVVTVNYRALDELQVLVEMVQRHSPADTRILVVDNEPSAETTRCLKAAGVRVVNLPINVGHGAAMDLGWFLARTEFAVALDVDAFPIADEWLVRVLEPLRVDGKLVAGGRLTDNENYRRRPYVQPCYLAMRRSTFARRRLSFRSKPGADTGEAITQKLGIEAAAFIDQTEVRGPGPIGSVFGDVVYHNFFTTRFRRGDDVPLDGIEADDPRLAWSEAVDRWVSC
jgi:GT2 family glycosyltransferase